MATDTTKFDTGKIPFTKKRLKATIVADRLVVGANAYSRRGDIWNTVSMPPSEARHLMENESTVSST